MKVDLPEIHYTQSGDTSIAYQVLGAGPVDVVFVPFLSNLVWAWEQPIFASFCRRLASFSRLILFDKRGTGLSDRPRELPTLEERMDDIRAVLDAVDSKVATLIGASSAGGQLCALFAATYPARTAALVLHDTEARVVSAPEYPGGQPLERWQARLEELGRRAGGRVHTSGRSCAGSFRAALMTRSSKRGMSPTSGSRRVRGRRCSSCAR